MLFVMVEQLMDGRADKDKHRHKCDLVYKIFLKIWSLVKILSFAQYISLHTDQTAPILFDEGHHILRG